MNPDHCDRCLEKTGNVVRRFRATPKGPKCGICSKLFTKMPKGTYPPSTRKTGRPARCPWCHGPLGPYNGPVVPVMDKSGRKVLLHIENCVRQFLLANQEMRKR